MERVRQRPQPWQVPFSTSLPMPLRYRFELSTEEDSSRKIDLVEENNARLGPAGESLADLSLSCATGA